ncbi:MAG: hypothetical protein KDA45_12015 [Planctomycetales bacterium]|nr:hypothetical protein [Planctomycetales bacterium]
MPIQLKCSCGHLLKVPDKFAGKTGKCPQCQKAIKIPAATSGSAKRPAGAAAAPAAGAKATSPAASKVPAGKAPAGKGGSKAATAAQASDGWDALFDEVGLTKKSGPVCPKCAAGIKPGAVVCTQCGFQFESGENLVGFEATRERPEFDNPFLQEASNNMIRDSAMDLVRDRSAMPWWVLMSFLIGALTLCAAGVVIVDGKFGTPSGENTFIGKVQRLPVFTVLGATACITGFANVFFAHLSICVFAFTKSVWHGLGSFFVPLLYSIPFGIYSWTENKAPVKAIMTASIFIAFGVYLIIQGGGFDLLWDVFS